MMFDPFAAYYDFNWLALEHFIDLHNTTYHAMGLFRSTGYVHADVHPHVSMCSLKISAKRVVWPQKKAQWQAGRPPTQHHHPVGKEWNRWRAQISGWTLWKKKSRWGSMPQDFFHTLVDSGHTHLWPYNSSNVWGAQTLNQIVHADPHVRPPAFEALAATLRDVQDLQKSNTVIYTAGRNPAVAKYPIIFNYNFKICSFPFSAFTISHFLVDHQLGLPTRVCTNWSGQVDFGPHSLDPIPSTHLYKHWLPTKIPQHSIQETSSKYFNI